MRSVEDIVTEVQSVKRSIEKRNALGAVSSPNLMEKATAQIARAIRNLHHVDMQAAERMYESIAAGGFDVSVTSMMTSAEDERLEQCLDDSQQSDACSNKGQCLLEPENWMVDELWELIRGLKPLNVKLQGCADHLTKCGVRTASEKTAGMWLSLWCEPTFQNIAKLSRYLRSP